LGGCGAILGTWNLSEISKVEGASAEKAWRASEVPLNLGKLQREHEIQNCMIMMMIFLCNVCKS